MIYICHNNPRETNVQLWYIGFDQTPLHNIFSFLPRFPDHPSIKYTCCLIVSRYLFIIMMQTFKKWFLHIYIYIYNDCVEWDNIDYLRFEDPNLLYSRIHHATVRRYMCISIWLVKHLATDIYKTYVFQIDMPNGSIKASRISRLCYSL